MWYCFNKHLNNIIKITAHKVNLLAKMRQYLTDFSNLIIYKTMILPYFDYGYILFTSSQKQLNCTNVGMHILNYMYKKKDNVELLDINRVNTRAHAAPIFKTIGPKKYRNSVLYKGAIRWNSLPVTIRNIDSYDYFKSLQKRSMLL